MNPELNLYRHNVETDPMAMGSLVADKRASLEGEALIEFNRKLIEIEQKYNEKLARIESPDTFTRVTEVSAINSWHQSEVRALCK